MVKFGTTSNICNPIKSYVPAGMCIGNVLGDSAKHIIGR